MKYKLIDVFVKVDFLLLIIFEMFEQCFSSFWEITVWINNRFISKLTCVEHNVLCHSGMRISKAFCLFHFISAAIEESDKRCIRLAWDLIDKCIFKFDQFTIAINASCFIVADTAMAWIIDKEQPILRAVLNFSEASCVIFHKFIECISNLFCCRIQ